MARYESSDLRSVFDASGELNLDRLTKEMGTAVFEDKRYTNVDEMKKKAITKSKDYDEFKNFVACAQDMLTPVTSTEFQELTKGKQGWRHHAATRATVKKKEAVGEGSKKTRVVGDAAATPPRQPSDFERSWRRARASKKKADEAETRANRLAYLRRHSPLAFANVFTRDLDAALTCEIANVLCDGLDDVTTDDDAAFFAVAILQALTLAPRFSLNVMFLDADLKSKIFRLIDRATRQGESAALARDWTVATHESTGADQPEEEAEANLENLKDNNDGHETGRDKTTKKKKKKKDDETARPDPPTLTTKLDPASLADLKAKFGA